MSYQVLALKWRPQVFDEVIGQEAVTRTLKNAIQQRRIAHAFLFSGVRGVGKTTTARILAKALNCSSTSEPTVSPCGECPSCKEIAASRSLDVLEIDGASHTKVEEIREVLEASRYAPSRDRFKIYVIDEVHMLSMHSFNALLKTLEEPPPHLKFIFATTEYHKIPDTIVSRCQQFEFRTVSSRAIADQLRRIAETENLTITDTALHQIARAAEGSMRDALSALDQVVAAVGPEIDEKEVVDLLGLIDTEVLSRTAKAIVERDTATLLGIVDQLIQSGRDLQSFARGLVRFLRDILVVHTAPDSPELVEMAGEREALSALANQVSEEDLVRSLDVLTQLEGALRWSPEPRFHLEVALLKLSELRRLASFEDLLARFEALESGPSPARSGKPSSRDDKGGGLPSSSSEPAPKRSKTRSRSREVTTEHPPGESLPDAAPASMPEAIVERVLERLRSAKPKLAALVSHHDGVSLEGDRLRLRFVVEQGFLREQIQQEDFCRLLESEASEAAGRPLRVDIAFTEAEPNKTPEQAQAVEGSATRNELYQRAMKDPLVRGFVETFRGAVAEVRPFGESTKTDSKRDK